MTDSSSFHLYRARLYYSDRRVRDVFSLYYSRALHVCPDRLTSILRIGAALDGVPVIPPKLTVPADRQRAWRYWMFHSESLISSR